MTGGVHTEATRGDRREARFDVVVVGSGPGGSIAAAHLAAAGARVVVLEEGGHFVARDFEDMLEERGYRDLYQDAGARATDDRSIVLFQGRSVGGGSTVNWMTSLRTPERTLRAWRDVHGVEGLSNDDLAPYFVSIERRLNVHLPDPVQDVDPNARLLLEGARALGLETGLLPRNAIDCTNLGVCGMGCPIDAKQTALHTYLRDAMAHGAEVWAGCRAVEVHATKGRAHAVRAAWVNPRDRTASSRQVLLHATWIVLAGSAINTPRLLLHSRLGGPCVGKRTFLHPVVATAATFEQEVRPWEGAPQSVGVFQFMDRGDRMGYVLETPPIHPMLAGVGMPFLGASHRAWVERLPHLQVNGALLVDGFHRDEPGGHVRVGRQGLAVRYTFHERLREAAISAMELMARIQFAAGAQRVATLHTVEPVTLERPEDVWKIAKAPFGPNRLAVFSAHQLGGCAMGPDPTRSVVDARGKVHGFENLYVMDASVFPTGLGVNPMLTIYAVSSLFARDLVEREFVGRALRSSK
ncbi:MAG: GMC family oxidoreductase [Planctomycetes bacterium]|nr:GMC family oxidoreductase [Planctomycetota bacterium]